MREVDPMKTDRARSWELYIDAPQPMVTIFKTLDISALMALKDSGYKLNMLLCYCIGKSAEVTREFRLLPVGHKMMQYDRIGVNVIVANKDGGINACDIPFCHKLDEFDRSYRSLTGQVRDSCRDHELEDHMIVGTSSLVKYDIDGVVNMYSGIFNNPFIIWGRYTQNSEKTTLKISFQFHHVQMDGMQACEFLERLQRNIDGLTS